jgi:hypothetical protein
MFEGYISFWSGCATHTASRAVLIGLRAPGGPGSFWGRSGIRACA